MNSVHLRARAAVFFALFTAAAWLALLSCSSDPTSTLGSDSDLLGSEPGAVYEDTIGVLDDTTYAMHTPIAAASTLETGYDTFFDRIAVMDIGFTELAANPGDAQRTVRTASLHLATGDLKQSFPVRFYGINHRYTEGDTLSDLSFLTDADAIIDTLANDIDRDLEAATQLYPIPASVAQRWIRNSAAREAIAIVYTDAVNQRIAGIPSSENLDDHPYLTVTFTDNGTRSYKVTNDATMYLPRTTPSHLVVSDGYARRSYFRAELDALARDSAVHSAHVQFHVVPGGFYPIGNDTLLTSLNLIIYIPDSTDPASPSFKTGQRITDLTVTSEQTVIDFPMTNAIFLILQEKLKNNGFAIRCTDENTSPRQIELYGTDAPDSLRPRIFVTSSTPADFH